MMKNKAYDLAKYVFHKDEPLLLDANVWLYLYPAPSGKLLWHANSYSNALKSMLTAGSHLVMDALILSEYINRYCRIEWKALHKRSQPDFKLFRKSAAFKSVGQGAATFTRSILKLCTRYDHLFSTANITQVLTDFETGANDINDGLLAETCRHHGWKLVTNDSDFTTGGIEVLTSHPGLLRACP
ncbi:MAG: PIN domain-containing protein [Elusimicrobia bacterium]|nr:PIN domain-containing protein [Elusimicrobiota bacterium]